MLNEGDIDLMHEWQDELYTLRERSITFVYVDKMTDPLTGVIIGEGEVTREVNAVVTELSSNRERYVIGGGEYEQGDIKVDVKIELIEDIAEKVERIEYDDKKYEILGVDKKGIGRRNRFEMLGREIA